MKKLLSLLMLITYSISTCQSKQEKPDSENTPQELFTFDRLTILKIEKDSRFKDCELVNGFNLCLGAIILKNENDSLSSGKYIKLSNILETEKFTFYGTSTVENTVIIQNVKTKLLYLTSAPFSNYFDYSRTDEDGFRTLTKIVPRALTAKEQELLSRYKTLIKKGQANCTILKNIQKRCLTRGYFDERKMTKIDIQNWNKNLSALKITYEKLNDIDRYEDIDNHAQDKLSLSELGWLDTFNNWLNNYFKIE